MSNCSLGVDEQRATVPSPAGQDAEFHQVVQLLPQIVWITRPDGWHTYFNQQWLDFTGLSLEESLGHGWNPPFHPEDRPRAAVLWEQATRTGEPYEIEYRLRRWDGSYRWMLGRALPIRNASGEIVKWFGTCTDIQELKQAQDSVTEQAQLLDLAQDAIVVRDLEQRILYWNAGAERIYGWSAAEALGRTVDELMRPDHRQIEAALAVLHSRGHWTGELVCVDRRGEEHTLEARWTLLHHDDGRPRGVLAVNTDVTERRATEAELIRRLEAEATHDPLTGLPNRVLLSDRLDQVLTGADREPAPTAVLFVDLDGFKDINDSEGHLLGDKVIVEVAGRLQASIRQGDTVSRFGGDEFVVLLPGADAETADEVAHRLLAAVREPMQVDGHRLHVSASIGLAASPPVDPAALLRAADAAVYLAKEQGRGLVRSYVGDLSAQAESRLRMSADLSEALTNDELHLVYQPIVDVHSGRTLGLEALVRWQHPTQGAVPPDVFVALAEKTGLARQLDEWVLRRSCLQFAQLRREDAVPPEAYLAVNVTAASAMHPHLPGFVSTTLREAELAADALVVEVTETSFMRDIDSGVATLSALRATGVRIAIDDFGTGWSSLTYLKKLPASIIKLDRSFVARLHEDPADAAIAESVIRLGEAIGLVVVAEGVETAEQLTALRQLGCTAAQGFLWHRGVPVDQVAAAVHAAAGREL